MKKILGTKITENPEIENHIILWIQNDNSISNYKIKQELEKQFNFKCSEPTIKRWRINFFADKEQILQVEKENLIGNSDDLNQINLKYEHLKNILVELDDLKDRKRIIKTILESKVRNDVPYIDTFTEALYRDYIKIIIDLEDKILKSTAGANPYLISREITEKIIEYVLVMFSKYNITDEDSNNLKQFLKDLDNENYIRYNIERKNGR